MGDKEKIKYNDIDIIDTKDKVKKKLENYIKREKRGRDLVLIRTIHKKYNIHSVFDMEKVRDYCLIYMYDDNEQYILARDQDQKIYVIARKSGTKDIYTLRQFIKKCNSK